MGIFKTRWFLVWLIMLLVFGFVAFLMQNVKLIALMIGILVILIILRVIAERRGA